MAELRLREFGSLPSRMDWKLMEMESGPPCSHVGVARALPVVSHLWHLLTHLYWFLRNSWVHILLDSLLQMENLN